MSNKVGVTQFLFGYFGKLVNFVAKTYSISLIILTSQKICRTFRDYLNQHLVQAIQQNLNQTSARKNGVQYKICRFCRKWRILPPSLSGFGFRPYIIETIFAVVLFGSNTTFSPHLEGVWLANCALSLYLPSVSRAGYNCWERGGAGQEDTL